MIDRIGSCCRALVLIVTVMCLPALAESPPEQNASAIGANGPVSLPDILADVMAQAETSQTIEAAETTDSKNAVETDQSGAAEAVVDPPAFEPPAHEFKQLGKASLPSIDRASTPSSAKTDGALSSLDPRMAEVVKVVGALAVVVGLVLVVRVVLKRAGGTLGRAARPSGVLEILARYPVGRGQQLLLLKVARRIVLVHQSGTAMATLSEMTDPQEVAGLLSRMEAGSGDRDAAKFRKTFSEFMAEHDTAAPKSEKRARPNLPPADSEIVDLTRRNRAGLLGWLVRRSAS